MVGISFNELHDRLQDDVAEPITSYMEKFPEIKVRVRFGAVLIFEC